PRRRAGGLRRGGGGAPKTPPPAGGAGGARPRPAARARGSRPARAARRSARPPAPPPPPAAPPPPTARSGRNRGPARRSRHRRPAARTTRRRPAIVERRAWRDRLHPLVALQVVLAVDPQRVAADHHVAHHLLARRVLQAHLHRVELLPVHRLLADDLVARQLLAGAPARIDRRDRRRAVGNHAGTLAALPGVQGRLQGLARGGLGRDVL